MAIRRSSAISVSSAKERLERAQSLVGADGQTILPMSMRTADVPMAAADTTEKTPDYHLPWTGLVVEETLRKMMEFNPSEVGGIIVLESTETNPADADKVLDPGNYTANYMVSTGGSWPESFTGSTPTNLTVYSKDGVLYQIIESMGDKYARFSTDGGNTWSVWSPKSTNSGGIDTSGGEDTPAPDPVEDLKEEVEQIQQKLANGLTMSTEEVGQAMLDGTFDYDTVINTNPTENP